MNWIHFVEWFDKNMIYCEQTHSFTHRLFDAFNKEKPENYREAQTIAWRILTTMQNEFFSVKIQEELDHEKARIDFIQKWMKKR